MSPTRPFHRAAAGLALLLGGCATAPPPAPVVVVAAPPPKSELWKRVAKPTDVARIDRIGEAWASALDEARAAGFRDAVKGEGRLLEGAAALPRPAPTPGSYSCRLVRVGGGAGKSAAFERFKPFYCYIDAERELLTLVKQTGTQRPIGRLWEDDLKTRLVYLGSLTFGDQDIPKTYGDDPKRDMAGVFERIAPFVWRLVIPWPQDQSKIDVYELTPVAAQPAPAEHSAMSGKSART